MGIEKIKRKKGMVYRVRIKKLGQIVASRMFDRHIDAIQFEKEAKLNPQGFSNERLTFQEACDKWLTNHAEVSMSPSSLVQDKVSLNAHVLPRVGRLKLIQITPEHLESIIVDLKKQGLASATISRILSPFSAIFNYFIRRRVLQFNPMTALDRRRLLKIECQDFDFWSLEEVRKFLQYTCQKYAGTMLNRNYLLYKVALNTGLRLGELRALKWCDIDFKNRLITVRQSYCDRKQGAKLPKSGKIRHVPISDAIHGDLWQASLKRTCELIFHRDEKVICCSSLRNQFFLKDMKEAGVRKIRFHDLRHTFASHFVMNGGNIFELQAILGHSDIKMTQRYAHLSKAFIASRMYVSLDGGKVIQADFGTTTGPQNALQRQSKIVSS